MSNNKLSKTNKQILAFIIKVVIFTLLFYGVLSAAFSLAFFKLDLSLNMVGYVAVLIDLISSFFVASLSTKNVKQSRGVMALISVVPIMIFSVINFCVYQGNTALFIIRILIIPSCALLAAMGKKKIKV